MHTSIAKAKSIEITSAAQIVAMQMQGENINVAELNRRLGNSNQEFKVPVVKTEKKS